MTNDLQQLIAQTDAFQRCQDCGEFIVDRSPHRCDRRTRGKPSRREERNQLAEGDGRDSETIVGIFRRSNGQTYAYHDIDNEGATLCGGEARTKAVALELVTLERAQALGRSPCGSCRRYRSLNLPVG